MAAFYSPDEIRSIQGEANRDAIDAVDEEYLALKAHYRQQFGVADHPRWCLCPGCMDAVDAAMELLDGDGGPDDPAIL